MTDDDIGINKCGRLILVKEREEDGNVGKITY
jgi:hypothetical protein